MSTTRVNSPTSRVRFGHARVDITPPVGIYHRMWGAARHDRATGVHRPLTADAMVFGPVDAEGVALIRGQADLVGLADRQHADLVRAMAEAAGAPEERVVLT